MLILFDQGTPVPISRFLKSHTVKTAWQQGWDTLKNGELLEVAERAGFEVFVTPDKNMQYQQNLTGRRIAVVVLGSPQWPSVRLHIDRVIAAIEAAIPGAYVEVDITGE
jgi:hypothetical protein